MVCQHITAMLVTASLKLLEWVREWFFCQRSLAVTTSLVILLLCRKLLLMVVRISLMSEKMLGWAVIGGGERFEFYHWADASHVQQKIIPFYRTPSTIIDSLKIPIFSFLFSTIFLNSLLILLECVDQMVSKKKPQTFCVWAESFPKMNENLNTMGQ